MDKAINLGRKQGGGETVVDIDDSEVTIDLVHNTIFNLGEVEGLVINDISTINADFMCQVNFTSGETATEFNSASFCIFRGDDVIGEEFYPTTNKRYMLLYFSFGDGFFIHCIVLETENY